MARLHEYQGKQILAANGFKIPRGQAATNPEEAVAAAKELGSEVVVKIQAWTTGRAGIGHRSLFSPAAAAQGSKSAPLRREEFRAQ